MCQFSVEKVKVEGRPPVGKEMTHRPIYSVHMFSVTYGWAHAGQLRRVGWLQRRLQTRPNNG